MSEFEAVIGLEVHSQLSTESKIFCACPAKAPEGVSVGELRPNSNTCPICVGHPGALPVMNAKAVEYAVRAGTALGCRINGRSVFARKNYFYPDLPKGYQTSQYDLPICEDGFLNIETSRGPKRVRVQRIHLEEDAGKNVHLSGFSLVNLNRAGVPLIEIVSHPDLSSPEEAGAYLRGMHAVVTYLGICDGNMQEGNFRCDANVSVRLRGVKELGTRVEIKNVNSFRFIEKAIDFEIARQIERIKAGGKITQETRLYDSARNVTQPMRSKEDAHDYRYFPDPDLLPLEVTEAQVARIRESLPELPEQKKQRLMNQFGLNPYDAAQVTASRALALFFDEVLQILEASQQDLRLAAKPTANLLTGEVARLLNEEGREFGQGSIQPVHVADLVKFILSGVVSSTGAKQVLVAIFKTGDSVNEIIEREGLKQVSDTSALEPLIKKVLAANQKQADELRSGKDKLMGFFVGQIMKEMGGKANPALLQELIRKKLGS